MIEITLVDCIAMLLGAVIGCVLGMLLLEWLIKKMY